jgi:hypothetical protein
VFSSFGKTFRLRRKNDTRYNLAKLGIYFMFTQPLDPLQSIKIRPKKHTLHSMDSRSNPPEALIWDPRHDQFDIVDPSTITITCVGISQESTCGNKIYEQNIATAKSVTHDLLHPGSAIPREAASQMRILLSDLAKATLCQQEHQDQAAALAHKWYSKFEWCTPPAPLEQPHGVSGERWLEDWGHELRQDWKEVAARTPFRWDVHRTLPRQFPGVMERSMELQGWSRDGSREARDTARRKRAE